MTEQQHTPETRTVRTRYVLDATSPHQPRPQQWDEAAAEFDRWLAEVQADAWDEGYEKDADLYPQDNPYRTDSGGDR